MKAIHTVWISAALFAAGLFASGCVGEMTHEKEHHHDGMTMGGMCKKSGMEKCCEMCKKEKSCEHCKDEMCMKMMHDKTTNDSPGESDPHAGHH